MSQSIETHEFRFIKPRPSPSELYEMIKTHFDFEAPGYDRFDEKNEKRRLYTSSINQLIVRNIPKIQKALSIACGTGRRDLEMRSLSKQNYDISGVELNSEMAKIAERNGLKCEVSNWIDSKLQGSFDAIFFLYAFGAFPDSRQRLTALQKARALLKDGSPLYLDVLNIDDENEWGPKIKREFIITDLADAGYELGDILYSKIGDVRLAYWHYFSTDEIEDLVKQAGFKKIEIKYVGYGKHPGKIVGPTEGAIYLEAR